MKKKFRSRIVAALVAVTALTCCFVGSTFAKYTSSKEQTATATAARWQITNVTDNAENTNVFEFTANKLSPNHNGTTNTLASSNLTITNESDVSATLTLTNNGVVVNYREDLTVPTFDLTAIATLPEGYANQRAYAEANVFTFTVERVTGVNANADGTYTLGTETSNNSVTLRVVISWNTLDTNGAEEGLGNGDAIDTYFGMYATDLVAKLNVTAVQASKLPA